MVDVVGVVSSIKSAYEIAKVLKDSSEVFDKAEVKLKLADLIGALAETKMEIASIQEENMELRNKLKQKSEYESKKNNYVLIESGKGTFLYKSKSEPEHYICPRCLENNSEFHIIQLAVYGMSEVNRCPSCDTKYYLDSTKE